MFYILPVELGKGQKLTAIKDYLCDDLAVADFKEQGISIFKRELPVMSKPPGQGCCWLAPDEALAFLAPSISRNTYLLSQVYRVFYPSRFDPVSFLDGLIF